jgi:hypothetical protein
MDQGPQRRRAALRARVLLALLPLVALPACAPPVSLPAGSPGPATVRLHVQNNSWSDFTVYSVRSGTRSRIGTVGSLSSRDFHLGPAAIAPGTVRLYAEPLAGGGGYQAPEVSVAADDRVELVLQNHLPLSTVSLASR